MELHDLLTRCGQELRDRASYQVSIRHYLYTCKPCDCSQVFYRVVGYIKFIAPSEVPDYSFCCI